jgi:hypothetical protein
MEVLRDLGDTVKQGWQDQAENWRDLISRGSSALTRFFHAHRMMLMPTQTGRFPFPVGRAGGRDD